MCFLAAKWRALLAIHSSDDANRVPSLANSGYLEEARQVRLRLRQLKKPLFAGEGKTLANGHTKRHFVEIKKGFGI